MALAQVLQIPFAPSLYAQPGGVLLQNLVSSAPASSLGAVALDQLFVQLFPRQLSSIIGSSSQTLQLSSGSTILFSLKSVAGLGGTVLLGESTAFTEYQDAAGNWYYGSIFSLTAAAVETALGSSPSIPCDAEIRITDATGATMRYQFAVTLYQAVYTGAESAISLPAPGSSLTFTNGGQAVPSGVDSLAITGLGLSAVPALIVPQLIKADGTKALVDCYLRAGWTAAGFTVDFDAVIPDGTYVLTWFIVNAGGSVNSATVAAGVDTTTIPLALARAPSFILPLAVKSASSEANIRAYLRGGWTSSGFTVDFDSFTPDATYVLYYLILP